jgi:hypothetical protein
MEVDVLCNTIADFNDPNSEVNVLVSALRFATGLNLPYRLQNFVIILVNLIAVQQPYRPVRRILLHLVSCMLPNVLEICSCVGMVENSVKFVLIQPRAPLQDTKGKC